MTSALSEDEKRAWRRAGELDKHVTNVVQRLRELGERVPKEQRDVLMRIAYEGAVHSEKIRAHSDEHYRVKEDAT